MNNLIKFISKRKYNIICIAFILLITIAFLIVYPNYYKPSSYPLEDVSKKEQQTASGEDATSNETNTKANTLGSEEIGYLTLSDEYKCTDLSTLSTTNEYYIGVSDKVCVGIILQDISFNKSVKIASNVKDYELKSDTTLKDGEASIIRQISITSNDDTMHCLTTLIYNKESGNTIAISISSTIPMTDADFNTITKDILKTYDKEAIA